jgi:hypothetical protein
MFDSTGVPLPPRQDIGENWATDAIVVPGNVQSLYLWNDVYEGISSSTTRGRLTALNGDSLTPNMRFDAGSWGYNSLGGAVWLSDSTFIVAWSQSDLLPHIMGRSGSLSVPNTATLLLLSDSSSLQSNSYYMHLATHEQADRFVATWMQGIMNQNTDTLHLRLFSKSTLPLGPSIAVVPDSAHATPRWYAVAMYPNGGIYIVWTAQTPGGTWNVYMVKYSKDGLPEGTITTINAAPEAQRPKAEVAMDKDGSAVVVWDSDESAATQIRAQRFNADGSSHGGNFLVCGKLDSVNQADPAISIRNGRVYVLWTEGNQIRGRVFGFDDNTFSVPPAMTFPEKIELNQNFPNPFNPSTTIRFGLPTRSHVTLSIFNTLGQKVATLVTGTQEAGYHEVRFDAVNSV